MNKGWISPDTSSRGFAFPEEGWRCGGDWDLCRLLPLCSRSGDLSCLDRDNLLLLPPVSSFSVLFSDLLLLPLPPPPPSFSVLLFSLRSAPSLSEPLPLLLPRLLSLSRGSRSVWALFNLLVRGDGEREREGESGEPESVRIDLAAVRAERSCFSRSSGEMLRWLRWRRDEGEWLPEEWRPMATMVILNETKSKIL